MTNTTILKTLLSEGKVVRVTFTKKDGSIRQMLCTTNPDLIEEKTFSKNSNPNTSVQSVWDLEKAAWRSFRWDSVIIHTESKVA